MPLRSCLLAVLAVLALAAPARAQFDFPFSIGTSGNQEALSVAVDDGGGIYVVGPFTGAPDFNPGPGTATLTSTGGFDVFVAKYSANGFLLWAFNIGAFATESVEGVTVTSDGGVAITGRFSEAFDADPGPGTTTLTPIGGNDVFVAKYEADGALDWAFSVGGTDEDLGAEIAATSDGGVVVAGTFGGPADFDPGSGTVLLTPVGAQDVFVARYDAGGTYVRAFNVGGNGTDGALGMTVAPSSGDITVVGTFEDAVDFDPGSGTASVTATGDNTNAFVASYTGEGGFRWVNGLTSPDNNDAADVAAAADGSVFVTGRIEATTAFGGGITVTPASLSDAYLARYEANGDLDWAFSVGGFSAGLGVGVAPGGDVVFTGRFNSGVGANDFDPGPGTVALSGLGGLDVFVARYESDNTFLWAYSATSPNGNSSAQGNAVAVDGDGNSFVVGTFSTEEAGESVTFNFAGGQTAVLTSGGSAEIFVAAYNEAGAVRVEGGPVAGTDVPVLAAPSPNPAREVAHVLLSLQRPQAVRVDVFDVRGRRVATLHDGPLAAGQTPLALDAAALPAGLYVIRAAGEDFSETVRATVIR